MTGSSEELFRPSADRYRRGLYRFLRVSMVAFFMVFAAVILQGPFARGMGIAGTVGIILALYTYVTLPKLRCPMCDKAPDSGIAAHCPTCGGSELSGRRCPACRKALGRYGFRNYTIRFCTHCGTLLDRRGV